MAKTTKPNPHMGSSFDDFLKEDGIYEEVQARALKRALAEQLGDAMQSGKISKVSMAQRMATSRSQLDRVLDPSNLSIQLDTLIKAASAVGRTVEIRLKTSPSERALRQREQDASMRLHSKVSDGASDVLFRVLGEAGRHTRTSVGVAQLPKGATVELDLMAAI